IAAHVIGCMAAGAISDRTGRKPVLLSGVLAYAFLGLPLFALVVSTEFARILAGTVLLMIPVMAFTGALNATIAELFPTSSRLTGVATGYNLGVSVFAGTAPRIATARYELTSWALSPSLLLIAASLAILPLVLRLPETFRLRLDHA